MVEMEYQNCKKYRMEVGKLKYEEKPNYEELIGMLC
jgi:hypothetical protein